MIFINRTERVFMNAILKQKLLILISFFAFCGMCIIEIKSLERSDFDLMLQNISKEVVRLTVFYDDQQKEQIFQHSIPKKTRFSSLISYKGQIDPNRQLLMKIEETQTPIKSELIYTVHFSPDDNTA